MHILMIAPPWYKIPVRSYGGIEIIVEHLCRGLLKDGHQVTLVAPPDSGIYCENYCCTNDIWYGPEVMASRGQERINMALMELGALNFSSYDIVHNHMGGSIAYYLKNTSTDKPIVTTLHGRYTPEFDNHVRSSNYVAISMSQISYYPEDTNIVGMVYNAIDFEKYDCYAHSRKYDYLTNVNRYSPNDEKGFMPTLRVAEKLPNNPFILSMFVEPKFENDELLKHIRDKAHSLPNVILLGGVTEYEKFQIVSRAKAFIFPLQWPEPFGLAPVEAQALGTPAIVYNNGSMSEVVKDGYSGFVVPPGDSITELAEKINDLDKIDSMNCIKFVKSMFTIDKMVNGYLDVYNKILQGVDNAQN